MVRTMDSKKPSEYFSKVEIEGLVDHLCTKHWDIFFSDSKHLFLLDNWSVRQVVLCRVIMDSIHWIPTSPYFNSQVSSWFCKTNDRLICPYPLLNMVVFENCFTGLLLKFYFPPFDDLQYSVYNVRSFASPPWYPLKPEVKSSKYCKPEITTGNAIFGRALKVGRYEEWPDQVI